jgi:hypothetical protein
MFSGIFVRSAVPVLAPCRPPSLCDALRAFPVCTSYKNEYRWSQRNRGPGARTTSLTIASRTSRGSFAVGPAMAAAAGVPGQWRQQDRLGSEWACREHTRCVRGVWWLKGYLLCGQSHRPEEVALRLDTAPASFQVRVWLKWRRGVALLRSAVVPWLAERAQN